MADRESRELRVIERANVSSVYGTGKGRKYGSWISDSGRSVGYSTSDFIQQPAYVIESILRDEMGLTDAKIDMTSFDVVGNTSTGKRMGWKFATSITTLKSSQEILAQLCYESFCILFEGSDGKYKLVALDTDSTPYLLIQNQMFAMQPQVGRTSVNSIKNQFNIGYHYNFATNMYERNFIVDELGSNLDSNIFSSGQFTPNEVHINRYGGAYSAPNYSLCSASQARFKCKYKLTVDLDWIYDDATAEFFTKKLVEWMYAPHITISVLGWWGDSTSASRKHFLAYELGDQVKVSHPLLNPTVSNNQIFMVTRKFIDRKNNSVGLELMQMR